VQIDGTVLADARASLVVAAVELIAPQQPEAPRERSVASVGAPPAPLEASPPPAQRPPVPATTAPKAPPALTEDQQRALAFVVRGRAQAQQGNIAAARLFYRRAADANLADGAFALAATYDPAELAIMGVAGVQPDIALARNWYEKARELGARDAEERLRRLSAR
jgi:TPR repeat protein